RPRPARGCAEGRDRAARWRRHRSSIRGRSRDLYPRDVAAEESGPSARYQCGVLHRDPARCADDPAPSLHADLRGCPVRGMDRARPRAAAGRAADTTKFGLYWPDALSIRWRRAIILAVVLD